MHKTSQMETLRKVLRYMKKYIPLLVISILLATVTVAMTLYFPILTGNALDLILEKGLVDFAGIAVILQKAIVVVAVSAVAQWIMNVCNNKITYSMPYARKQYYSNAGAGKEGNSKGGLRGKLWVKRCWSDKGKDICKSVAQFVGGRAE